MDYAVSSIVYNEAIKSIPGSVCVCVWGVSQHGLVVYIYSEVFEIVSHEVYGNKDCECLFLFADSISFRLSFLKILMQFDDTCKREQEIFDKYVN